MEDSVFPLSRRGSAEDRVRLENDSRVRCANALQREGARAEGAYRRSEWGTLGPGGRAKRRRALRAAHHCGRSSAVEGGATTFRPPSVLRALSRWRVAIEMLAGGAFRGTQPAAAQRIWAAVRRKLRSG